MAKGRGRSIFWTVICTIVLLGAAALGFNAYRQSTCEHEYGEGKVVKEATCTEDGEIEYECDKCWKVKTENIKATGHKVLQLDAVRATCTSTGLHAGEMCEVCEKVLVPQEVIPILAHDLEKVEGKESTCTERGYFEYEACKDCDYTTEIVYMDYAHEYETVAAQASTCTEVGWNEHYRCTLCGDKKGYVEVAMHDYETVSAQEPSCNNNGWTEYQACSRCGVQEGYMEIPATGHSYVNGTCLNCGEEEVVYTEVEATKGELVAGNRYRAYEYNKGMVLVKLSCSEDAYFYLSSSLSSDQNRYLWVSSLGSGPVYKLEGMEVVVTDEYVELYFEAGTYNILKSSGESTGLTFTIDETTTITGLDEGKVYRLEEVE